MQLDDYTIYNYYLNKIKNREHIDSIDLILSLYIMCKNNNCQDDPMFQYLEETVLDHMGIFITKQSILQDETPKTYYPIHCEFKEFCNDCNGCTTRSDLVYKFCYDCNICNGIKSMKTKLDINTAFNKYKKNLKKEDVEIENKSSNNININITNNTIINNNLTVKNYIDTKDKFFEVFILNKHKSDINHLKHIFIYCMCRTKARELFPGENQYNYSETYPISAATYCIEYDKNKPVLHGLLRYQNTKSSWININKLQNITNDKTIIIIVNDIKNHNDNKYQINKNQVTEVFNNITKNEFYGSVLDSFCEDTL